MDQEKPNEFYEGAHADSLLSPASAALPQADAGSRSATQPPAMWCAQAVIGPARQAYPQALVYLASSERRADEIGRALRQLAPDVEVLVLPPWDCLPYDRASPSRETMGRRMAVLATLAKEPAGPRVLVTSVDALLQRVPPPETVRRGFLQIQKGEPLDRVDLNTFAVKTGYVFDDRIDEPGEIAILGSVVDIYPAAAEAPVRIALNDQDEVLEIKRYDPLSQRTEAPLEVTTIGPASELIIDPQMPERQPGAEHRAFEFYGAMYALLDLAPQATLALDPKAHERAAEFLDQVAEAYEARRQLAADGEDPVPTPDKLYLDHATFSAALIERPRIKLNDERVQPIPRFAVARNPGRAFSAFVQTALDRGNRVLLTGLAHELRLVARALKRGTSLVAGRSDGWSQALEVSEASLLALEVDVDAGFVDPDLNLVVIAAADVLGGRAASRGSGSTSNVLTDPDLRVGDVVIHENHGLGVLVALETVEVDGEPRDALRLEYHGGAHLLVPVEDFGRVWRYGAEREAVTLDRLHTDAWRKRRAELSSDIDRSAEHLVALAQARSQVPGRVIQPPKAPYARLAARFPYPETPDQAAAIDAVLEDLASGRVMNRLVCGDVGFGKTEVALRAATAVALTGAQVAIVAPTTVLARQHAHSIRRRFEGIGIETALLSRLGSKKESQSVKQGLAEGSIQIVVGTHALAADDVAFRDLGLLIIDEEQRFGAHLKAKLAQMAPGAHRLTMTATPIPRTLQLAMVGVEDVSIIATPPARRRPIRTFLAPYDPATVRTALLRERRRGGQSFVVAPRVEDMGPLVEELARLVPELTVRVAHGQLPPDKIDRVMVDFAAGEGDVLLATNIIESGLDVPRANTMLVTRADLFGLAQLHQLRGRVGRGRSQGVAYLFHAADSELPEPTRARLSTLVAFDRLGSGLAISARDLELRGAGDLVGEEQAGHMMLIGTALYQRLLSRAVRVAKGEAEGPEVTPELNLGFNGAIPEVYVPDPTIRINLYVRLARMTESSEVDEFAEELEDRFGPPPEELQLLLNLTRIRTMAAVAGLARIDAGPKGVAFTPAAGHSVEALSKRLGFGSSKGRLIAQNEAMSDAELPDQVLKLLAAIID